MNRTKFLERVRSGSASFRVDDITIRFPDGQVSGSGKLELANNKFRCDVRLPDGVVAARPRGGVITKKDFGSMEGTIDYDLPFQIKNLMPTSRHLIESGRSTLRYRVDAIELSAVGSDTQTYDQIRRSLQELESPELGEERVESGTTEEVSDATFSGILLGFKLIARNAGTHIEERNDFLGTTTTTQSDTQCGSLSGDWDYALIERGDDVEFHLRLKDGRKSTSADSDLAALDAFLKAVAFIHGQHAWPFTLEFRRDHKLITDRVRAPKIAKRSPHQPFNERIWFNSVVGNLQWDFGTALQKAYAFFQEKNEVNSEVSKLLFLCREAAGGDAHTTIANIALCSLLDSAVNLVFENRVERDDDERVIEFNAARSTLLGFITAKIATVSRASKEAWKRFHSIITNSESESAREKFRAVGDYIGLKWEDFWEDIYRFWAKWRPRLVHRGTGGGDSEEEIAAEFNIGSRVIGAIHMLVLKLMGYANSSFPL